MRLRRLDANGDMTFGRSQGNLWIDQPEGVGQLVMTRLRLDYGEWFVDRTQGTPWNTQVLGERTAATRNVIIRERILDTIGVLDIISWGSRFDPDTRQWNAQANIDTIYGPAQITAPTLPGAVPPLPPLPQPPTMLATGLGIEGGTPLSMTPADLTASTRVDVTNLEIENLSTGSW